MYVNLHEDDIALKQLTRATNRHPRQELFLFDLVGQDYERLVKLEEAIHRCFISYCPSTPDECNRILTLEYRYDGIIDFNELLTSE